LGDETLPAKDRKTVTAESEDADLTDELANYLDVLGSSVRLKILRIIEREPLDTESISHELYEMDTKSCRENTEKHLKKLLKMGLVRKEPGEKNGRGVMNYVVVTGAIETAMRTTRKVLKLNLAIEMKNEATKLNQSLTEEFYLPRVKVLGGVDDGKEFSLKKPLVKIGRVDPDNTDKYDVNDVVLSSDYKVVSRVWKPQALLSLEQGQWYVQQGEGINTTAVWENKLKKGRKEPLKDEDIIHLAEGDKSVRLLFLLPKHKNEPETDKP
jgi:DNA-binding MarR family transcriptional regulator